MRPDYSQRVIRSGDRLSIVKLSFKSAFDAPQRLVPFPPFLFCGAFFGFFTEVRGNPDFSFSEMR